jgi:hypothetical protein
MEWAYDLGGDSNAVIRKYQVAATNTVIGIPYLVPAADGSGVVIASTTGAADAVGVNVDAAGTYVTAQQTDASDTARLTSLIINPHGVFRLLMSGGATEGTVLALHAITTASSDGLTLTTGTTWTGTEFDEGTAFGYDGANAGKARKITSTGATSATVTVAFPYDTVVGDNFIRVPYNPLQRVTVQLTTTLTQANAAIAVGTGAALQTIELLFNDIGGDGRTNSYVFAQFFDHQNAGRPA